MNVYIRKKSFLWQKVMLAVLLVAGSIFLLNIFDRQIKNSFYYATFPVSRVLWQAGDGASWFLGSLLNAKGISQENANLTQENQNLLAQVATLKETIKARQDLASALQATAANSVHLTLAQVIGLDSLSDTIVVNKGSDDGIKENMPVISSANVLYGKVSTVYKNFSKVLLVSSPQSVVDAKTQNSDPAVPSILGVIKGQGNFSVYLDLVPSDAKLQKGDLLVTSALEGIFPKDLLIGKIVQSTQSDAKPFQTAQIQPFFDLNHLDNLFIITDYKK